jgi:hypothetical protein
MAMTEQEWLACSDPVGMIRDIKDKGSDRKWWLFAAAGYCLPSLHLPGNMLRYAFEGFADGLASSEDRKMAREFFAREKERFVCEQDFEEAAWCREVEECIERQQKYPRRLRPLATYLALRIDQLEDRAAQMACYGSLANFLRDIFGHLFLAAPPGSSLLTANVKGLATAIYSERAFDRLPILADALEDAGCDNSDILNHCRQPGEHVRGCWVVDLILGKK